jgi:hypothetical protein
VVLASLEGRAADLVRAVDGRSVTVRALDCALGDVAGVLHWRLRQKGTEQFDLDLLGDGTGPPDLGAARERLAPLLGAAPRVRQVGSLPVEVSGKFRLAAASHGDLGSRVSA